MKPGANEPEAFLESVGMRESFFIRKIKTCWGQILLFLFWNFLESLFLSGSLQNVSQADGSPEAPRGLGGGLYMFLVEKIFFQN